MADLIIAGNSVPFSAADRKPASGTPQYFTSGNPGTSTPATVWPAYAANMLVAELANFVKAGGLVPDGDIWDQCWQAVLSMQHFWDTGTTNSIVIAPPAGLNVTTRAGQIIHVTVNATNNGPTFLNLSGFVAPVKRPDGATLVAGDILQFRTYTFLFDSIEWVLLLTDVSNIMGIVPVPHGGTGDTFFNIGALLAGNGVSPLYEIAPINGNYPLCSNGPGNLPSYQNLNADKIVGNMTVFQGGTGQSYLPYGTVLLGNAGSGILQAAPGAAGQPLISNGVGAVPSFNPLNLSTAAGAVTGRLNMTRAPVQLFGVFGGPGPGFYDYQVLPDVYWLYVEVCGGGGGGAGTNNGGALVITGGGGGAAGYAAGWVAVTPGEIVHMLVGAGGAYGPYSPGTGSGNGTNGDSSSFSASGGALSASGGLGGKSNINAAGGDGGIGTGSVGCLVVRGGYGSDGSVLNHDFGGNGGASFFGGGIRGGAGGPPGTPAAFGAGGGGGYADASGSSGIQGVVILRG